MNAFEHVKEACSMKRKGHTANNHDEPPETSSDRAEQSHYFSHFKLYLLVWGGRFPPSTREKAQRAQPTILRLGMRLVP